MNQLTNKMLNSINRLEGMISEIEAKKKLLKNKLNNCHTSRDLEQIKNISIVLNSELDNIVVCIDLIEDLQAA